MSIRRLWILCTVIFLGLVNISITANAKTLDGECDAEDSSCIAVAVAFVKLEATQSEKRLDTIYRSYEKVLSESERGALKAEQAIWRQTALSNCDLSNDVIGRWSCIGWNKNERSMELDRRLGNKLSNSSSKLRPELFPISLVRYELGISSSEPTYYSRNVDRFQLSQESDGRFTFSYVVVGGNGHVCSGGGNAMRDGNSFYRTPDLTPESVSSRTEIEDPEAAELLNHNCKVKIRLFPYHIEFEGNRECHEYFTCGERASPKGEFFRDSRASLSK